MTSRATHSDVALPAPRNPGHAGTLAPTTQSTLATRVGELTSQLNAGGGPLVTGPLASEAKALTAPDGGRTTYGLGSAQDDQLGPGGSIHAVAVERGGTLALVDLVAETIHKAEPGTYLDTRNVRNSYLEATGQVSEYATQIVLRNAVTIVVQLDSRGRLDVLPADSAALPVEGRA